MMSRHIKALMRIWSRKAADSIWYACIEQNVWKSNQKSSHVTVRPIMAGRLKSMDTSKYRVRQYIIDEMRNAARKSSVKSLKRGRSSSYCRNTAVDSRKSIKVRACRLLYSDTNDVDGRRRGGRDDIGYIDIGERRVRWWLSAWAHNLSPLVAATVAHCSCSQRTIGDRHSNEVKRH